MTTDELIFEHNGYKAYVKQEEVLLNPRNIADTPYATTIWCWHNRYELGDQDTDKPLKTAFANWKELETWIEKNLKPLFIRPIYMYDHSGIGVSLSNHYYPFNCPWDSGQVGFIFITRKHLRTVYETKRLTAYQIQRAEARLRTEFEDWAAYIEGDVIWWYLEDPTGRIIAEDGPYYGYERNADTILTAIKAAINELNL